MNLFLLKDLHISKPGCNLQTCSESLYRGDLDDQSLSSSVGDVIWQHPRR